MLVNMNFQKGLRKNIIELLKSNFSWFNQPCINKRLMGAYVFLCVCLSQLVSLPNRIQLVYSKTAQTSSEQDE